MTLPTHFKIVNVSGLLNLSFSYYCSASGPYQEVGYRCSGDEELLEECQPVAAFSRSTQHYIGLRCGAPQPQPGTNDELYLIILNTLYNAIIRSDTL